MDSTAIASVSISVVALTQFAKWGGVPDKYGPMLVMVLSCLGLAFWGYSKGTFERTVAFDYFAAWVLITTSAAGVFGFTRAAAEAITKTSPPPAGAAGSSSTVKTNG